MEFFKWFRSKKSEERIKKSLEEGSIGEQAFKTFFPNIDKPINLGDLLKTFN